MLEIPTLTSRKLVVLVFAVCCLHASPCLADFEPVCRPKPFKGAVRTIVFQQAAADVRTLRPLANLVVRSVTNVTRDGRTMSEERPTEADTPIHRQLGVYPVTIAEFDSAGRMTSETQKLNGVTPSQTTTCEYDKQGRLIRAVTKHKDPMYDRVLTYSYDRSLRSERFQTAAASILTTVTLGPDGMPQKEVRFDERQQIQKSEIQYRRLDEGIETCVRQGAQTNCRTTLYDDRGNAIEYRSNAGASKTVYEYDSVGNWVSRVTMNASGRGEGEWRKITYW
jgi:hypothetical protein